MAKRSNEIYQRALNKCKCGCLITKDVGFQIDNKMWVRSQINLFQSRESFSNREKDSVLRQALFLKLKEIDFKARSSKVQLYFNTAFQTNDDGETTSLFSLCETCFVAFNDHVGNDFTLLTYIHIYCHS